MKSMTRWKAAWFAALVAAAGLHAGAASAQSGYKIGISGAATGPASPSYLPHIEGLRIYLSQLNDKGGVNGTRSISSFSTTRRRRAKRPTMPSG